VKEAAEHRLVGDAARDVNLPPSPKRLLIKNAKRMMRLTPAFPPSAAALRVKPAPALVTPRRIVHALMSLEVLKRRRRELDLRERVHPRNDGSASVHTATPVFANS
jgi:hypothetical protein